MENYEGEDRRAPRLVGKKVDVKVSQGENSWHGYTTGMNEKGLGVRLKPEEGTTGTLAREQPVEIILQEKALEVPPIKGNILRLEGSWVPGYECFVAVEFEELPEYDLQQIKEYIEWQRKDYLTEEAPQRIWYIYHNDKRYGPLTSEEVEEAIENKDCGPTDLIWSAEHDNWIELAQSPVFGDLFQKTTEKENHQSSITRADKKSAGQKYKTSLAITIIILLTGTILYLLLFSPSVREEKRETVSSPPPETKIQKSKKNKPPGPEPAAGEKKNKTTKENNIQIVDRGNSSATHSSGYLLTNFNSGQRITSGGGAFGAWSASGGTCREKIIDAENRRRNKVWKIDYDINKPGAIGGTWLELKELDGNKYSHLSFEIKGIENFSETIRVELKAANGARMGSCRISGISKYWQTVKIPLKKFTDLGSKKNLNELTFVFNSEVCGTNIKGTYYVDNILFR